LFIVVLFQLSLISALTFCIHICIHHVVLTQTALLIPDWCPVWKTWLSR